jgi:hypothetical protein
MERIFEPSAPQQFIISRLAELVGGLRTSEKPQSQTFHPISWKCKSRNLEGQSRAVPK